MNRILSTMIIMGALLALLAPSAGAGMEPRTGLPQGDMPQATSPTVVSYQGRVTVSGVPHTGTGYFKFAIVNDFGDVSYWSNDGSSIGGGEPADPVALNVSGGLFNVLLGDTSLPGMFEPLLAVVFSADGRYLRVWFATTPGGPYTLLSPDRRIGSAPYALNAETLDGQDASAFASASHDHWGQFWSGATGDGLTLSGGSVGLSATSRDIGVYGEATSTITGTHRGVVGIASTTDGPDYGVYGVSDDTGVYGMSDDTGVYGQGDYNGVFGGTASFGGTGVFGFASSTDGFATGVWGQSWSSGGIGVRGQARATTGFAYGVYGESDSIVGLGVYGYATATSGTNYGVWGASNSTSGRGMFGYAIATSGSTYGVYGQSASTSGYGVYGTGPSYGVYGRADATTPGPRYGVYGSASGTGGTNYGVYATATGGGTNYGVFATSEGYGVYGQAISTDTLSHFGVYGNASNTAGTDYGVFGTSDDTGVYGTGLYGVYGSGSAYGVYGEGLYGVYGKASSTSGLAGVVGDASGTGPGWGVIGTSDDTGVYGYVTTTITGSHYGVYGSASGTLSTDYGVYGSSDDTGVYGSASSTTTGTHVGMYGYASNTAGTNYGVYGTSSDTGVYGGGADYGVYGQSNSTFGTGVFGKATATSGAAWGVYGQSNSAAGTGVTGYAGATSGTTWGVWGQADSTTYGTGVYGYASAASGYANGVHGLSRSTQGVGVFGEADATSGQNYGVVGWSDSPNGYGVFFYGGLSGFGSKAAIVETQDYGWRHLYAVESPGIWFEDFGQAQLVEGKATVTIEPIFAQTVNLAQPYHVFLTPLGDCALYVAEKTPTSFTVRALGGQGCTVAFDYRIIARRLGYEDLRLKPAPDPATIAPGIRGIPERPGIKEGVRHEAPNGR